MRRFATVLLLSLAACGPSVPSAAPSLAATQAPSVASLPPESLARAAQALGVGPNAVTVTEDGVVAVTHDEGRTRLRLASHDGIVYDLAAVDEAIPAGAQYASLSSVDCSGRGLVRSRYLIGLFTDRTDRQLRIDGVEALGGVITDDAWLFALAPQTDPTDSFEVFGVRPEALYLGKAADAAVPCLFEVS